MPKPSWGAAQLTLHFLEKRGSRTAAALSTVPREGRARMLEKFLPVVTVMQGKVVAAVDLSIFQMKLTRLADLDLSPMAQVLIVLWCVSLSCCQSQSTE